MSQHPNDADLARRIVAFERRLLEHMHEITVPVHLSLGHEHVAVEIAQHFRPGDWWFSTHRNHHHFIAAGGDEQKLWDEIMGLESGVNGGFSGSQAISDASINFHSSAIVGGLVGAAVGAAYALKMDGSQSMVVCCTGDGGTEAGVFWESLNFAALHHLPIAFIVENNGKSVDALLSERQATPLSPRARAFGVLPCDRIVRAMTLARMGHPTFHEAVVTLNCDHINMGRLPPSKVI